MPAALECKTEMWVWGLPLMSLSAISNSVSTKFRHSDTEIPTTPCAVPRTVRSPRRNNAHQYVLQKRNNTLSVSISCRHRQQSAVHAFVHHFSVCTLYKSANPVSQPPHHTTPHPSFLHHNSTIHRTLYLHRTAQWTCIKAAIRAAVASSDWYKQVKKFSHNLTVAGH